MKVSEIKQLVRQLIQESRDEQIIKTDELGKAKIALIYDSDFGQFHIISYDKYDYDYVPGKALPYNFRKTPGVRDEKFITDVYNKIVKSKSSFKNGNDAYDFIYDILLKS
jgi:hypothetical protein